MAEGLGSDSISPCARRWTDYDHGYFQGAFIFGTLNLGPRVPEGVEDNPYDLVPQITFVHRSLAEQA